MKKGTTMRHHVGILMAAIATALSLLLGFVIVDVLTGEYVGWEVDAGRFIIGFVGLITTAAWLAAVALLRSARRINDRGDGQSNRS